MNSYTFKYLLNLPRIEVSGSIVDDGIGATAAGKISDNIHSQLLGWQKEDIVNLGYSSEQLKKALSLSITSDEDGTEKNAESVSWEVVHKFVATLKS